MYLGFKYFGAPPVAGSSRLGDPVLSVEWGMVPPGWDGRELPQPLHGSHHAALPLRIGESRELAGVWRGAKAAGDWWANLPIHPKTALIPVLKGAGHADWVERNNVDLGPCDPADIQNAATWLQTFSQWLGWIPTWCGGKMCGGPKEWALDEQVGLVLIRAHTVDELRGDRSPDRRRVLAAADDCEFEKQPSTVKRWEWFQQSWNMHKPIARWVKPAGVAALAAETPNRGESLRAGLDDVLPSLPLAVGGPPGPSQREEWDRAFRIGLMSAAKIFIL
jgi:hypothetical protein